VDLFAVWGRGASEIVAVGQGGDMLLFNGSVWTLLPQTATGENLRAIHAAPGGNFVAAGWNGTAIQRRSNGSWQLGAAAPLLFDLATGPGNTRFAVGGSGAVLQSSGGAWTPLQVERIETMYGAATDNGTLLVGEAVPSGATTASAGRTNPSLHACYSLDLAGRVGESGGPGFIVGS
jgi:hypothetical protein